MPQQKITHTMDIKSTEAQLQLISEMLERTRKNIAGSSIFFLVWGWLVLASTLIQWGLYTLVEVPWHWAVWPVLMSIGGIFNIFMGKKLNQSMEFNSHLDTIANKIWIGASISIFLALFLSHFLGWTAAYVIIMLIYAFATYITGILLKFKPLVYGAWFTQILVLALALIPALGMYFENLLLIMAASILGTYLIPGYLLRKQKVRYV